MSSDNHYKSFHKSMMANKFVEHIEALNKIFGCVFGCFIGLFMCCLLPIAFLKRFLEWFFLRVAEK